MTVLERGSDIGGRCRSARLAGQDVPLGDLACLERDTALIRLAEELGLRGSDNVLDLTAAHMLRLFRRDGSTDDVESITPGDFWTFPFVPWREKLALARLGLPMARMALTGGYRAPENAAELDEISATDWFRRHAPVMYDKFFEPTSAMFCGYSDHEMSLAWMMWANGKPKLSFGPLRFWTLKGGGGRLANTLAQKLADQGTKVMLKTEVRSLTADANGSRVVTNYEELDGDAAVVARTPRVVSSIMPSYRKHAVATSSRFATAHMISRTT